MQTMLRYPNQDASLNCLVLPMSGDLLIYYFGGDPMQFARRTLEIECLVAQRGCAAVFADPQGNEAFERLTFWS